MQLADAIKIGIEQNRSVRHPLIVGGAYIRADKLMGYSGISVTAAISDAWELEPRVVTMPEDEFRAKTLPVMRKFVQGQRADEIIAALQEVLF